MIFWAKRLKLMLSSEFLINRKDCCGEGCHMCPYDPPHLKKNIRLRDPGKSVRKGSYSKSSMTSHWDWDYMSSKEIDKLFFKENNINND